MSGWRATFNPCSLNIALSSSGSAPRVVRKFPIITPLIPALTAAMTLTTDLLAGMPLAGNNLIWLRVLAAFDIVFTALAVVFIDVVLVG